MNSTESKRQDTHVAGPVALLLTIVGVLARLLPHPPNFAPVGAASLFAGARLPAWQAYLIPVGIMAITDPILNAYYGFHLFTGYVVFTYVSYLIAVWIGRRLRATNSFWRIGAAAIASSLQFFLITNFGSWALSGDYEHTFAGLARCYTLAIPFFRTTVLSDLFFTAVLFGLHAWVSRSMGVRKQTVAA
jgi:hypothetical protein